jgi:hypothetical protein
MKITGKMSLMGLLCFLFIQSTEANTKLIFDNDSTKGASNTYEPIHLNLEIKNMHLWRGYRVTSGAMSGGNLNYHSKNQKFKAGLWGGAGFNGEYREFDYYLSYNSSGFSIAVWDINNFTDYPDAKIFDYSKANTSHFIDVTIGYQFKTIIPFKLSWSTIIQGRDTYLNNQLELKNAYSNFVAIDVPILKNDKSSLHIFTAYAFSFLNKSNFYGARPNIVELGLGYEKKLSVFNHNIPVGAKAMWNPEQGYGGIQFSAKIF